MLLLSEIQRKNRKGTEYNQNLCFLKMADIFVQEKVKYKLLPESILADMVKFAKSILGVTPLTGPEIRVPGAGFC